MIGSPEYFRSDEFCHARAIDRSDGFCHVRAINRSDEFCHFKKIDAAHDNTPCSAAVEYRLCDRLLTACFLYETFCQMFGVTPDPGKYVSR